MTSKTPRLALVAAMLTAITAMGAPPSPVPTLDSMAADWLLVSDLHSYPAVNNCSGALQTVPNVLGITNLKFPPLAQGGDTAILSVNGSPVSLHKSRWFPYQMERAADTGGFQLSTIVRMPFEQQGVLFSVTVTNSQDTVQTPALSVALRGYVRSIPGTWARSVAPPSTTGYTASLANGGTVLVVNDTQSNSAAAAFAFATPPDSLATSGSQEGVATWTPTLAPGQSVTIEFVMAAATNTNAAVATATGWATAFPTVYNQAQSLWEARWQHAFQPGNPHFSGSFPVLDTTDAKLKRLYYMSALSLLLMERTNFPTTPRAYVTGAPDQLTTSVYYWDTACWPDLWAQLDPEVMKLQCKHFLTLDFHGYYAMDALTGNSIGYRYSASDMSVFQLWWSYLTTTGDWDALNEVVAGKTVLEHLRAMALYWQSQVPNGANLASYGGASNIFSINSNYVQQVASLNAANVGMMRRMGDLYTRLGQTANATAMDDAATTQAPKVLALYNGDGTWNCIKDGANVNIRQVYDYILLGRYMANDLSATIRSQMTSFVEDELLVPCWMRALSLSDPYLDTPSGLSSSGRPDHGYTGAYDSWPAMTAGTMMQFGNYDKALTLLRNCETATHIGPFSQSHQLFPASDHAGVMVPDHPAINPTGTITVEAWVNASGWQPNSWQGSIVCKHGSGSGKAGYVLRCGENGRLSFNVAAGGNWYEALTGTAVLPLNGWHHVAGTYDGSRLRVYVNGVERASVACTAALSPSTYPLCVGRSANYTGRTFIGEIDGVRVYRRALTAGELAAQVALGGGYSPSDTNALALDLPLNEGSGTTAANLASGGADGTLFDATAWSDGRQGGGIRIPAPSSDPNNVYLGIGSQVYNQANGAAFADAILTGLFGFAPGADGAFHLVSASTPRGFTGTLSGVRHGETLYEIESDGNGLTATGTVLNQPPTVALTTPQSDEVFYSPASINMTADASDTDGTVVKVEFYNNATKLGEDTTAPYGFNWTGVAAGTYSITARAIDTASAFTDSAPANITVSNPSNTGIWTNSMGGSWSSAANWSGGIVMGGIDKTADFSALDLTTDATVTLDGAVTIGSLIFGDTVPGNDWNLTALTAGTLTLNVTSGTPSIKINNQTTTISAALAGTQGLIKSGAGTLTLSNVNTYTGTTTVTGGSLQLGDGVTNGSITGPLANEATVVFNPAGSTTYAGAISGSSAGVFVKTGSGSQVLTGGITSSGAFQINQGTLRLDRATATAPTWANISGAGTLALNSAQAINGSANWGTLALPADFTGVLRVEKGRVNANSGSTALGGAGKIEILTGAQFLAFTSATPYTTSIEIAGTGWGESGYPGGLRLAASNTATWDGSVTLTADSGIMAQRGASLTVAGSITGAYLCEFYAGDPQGDSGVLTVAPAAPVQNSYASTRINGRPNGSIVAGNAYAFSSGPLEMVSAILKFNGNSHTFASLTGTGGKIGNYHASAPAVLTVGDSNDTAYSGSILDGGAAELGLTKTGAGTLTLTGTLAYSGNTTISGGTLSISSTSLNDAATVSIASGAKIALPNAGGDTVGKLILGGTAVPAGTYDATHPTYGSYFSGTGSLVVIGGYSSWTQLAGLNETNNGLTQDPDNDGLTNLMEYYLGGNPLASDSSKLPVQTPDATYLILAFKRRDDARDDVASQLVQYGSGLTGWTDVVLGSGGTGPDANGVIVEVIGNDTAPDDIRVKIPRSLATKLFARLSVSN